MINAIPQFLAILGLCFSLLTLIVDALLVVDTVRHGSLTHRGLFLARDIACLCFSLVWCLFLVLAIAGLTFHLSTAVVLRWALSIVTVFSLLLSLLEHEWTLLLPGLFPLLTLPFFESSFGPAFPYVLVVMLALTLAENLIRLIRNFRRLPNQLSLSSIQEAIDTLDDGLLFAGPDGTILLANRIMDDLSISLCHQELTNANVLWAALDSSASTEFVTKISCDGSYLFRFTGGNTWTFHRETFQLDGQEHVQIVALNVTESDNVQRQMTAKRAELGRTALQLQQVEETIAKLQEEEARVDRGRKAFDSITEKMAALNRFFTEHYALPAETFDYKRLAVLTGGLLEELEHAPALTPEDRLRLTVSALGLLGVTVQITGSLPEHTETAAAFSALIREASINAVLHGNASTVTIQLQRQEDAFHCHVENDGAALTEPLVPRSGITSIRRLLFPLGGMLEITKEPVFALHAQIPLQK